MFVAYAVISVLTAALLVLSAKGKLRREPRSVRVIHEVVGMPLWSLRWLAACELAGAVGLLAGIAWAPLGIAAAAGLVLYFVGAVLGHVRVGDFKGTANPVLPLVLSLAALITRILSL